MINLNQVEELTFLESSPKMEVLVSSMDTSHSERNVSKASPLTVRTASSDADVKATLVWVLVSNW